MTTEELMKLMQDAGQQGTSELNMRSEDLQTKHTVARIKSLKKELKKKSKLLMILEIALPFNPMTGEADETYNTRTKFRPPVSATSAALIIKKYANECAKTKEVLMRRAGLAAWDTSDPDKFTDEDWHVFAKYRVPRLFSINVVSVKIPAITKEFTQEYAIKVNRDPETGEIRGEWPIALQINKLFRDKIYEEINELQDRIDSGELRYTEDQQKEAVRSIYGKNPVSDDHPANWAELIEIPLTNKYAISSDFEMDDVKTADIKAARVVSRYSKGLKDLVNQYIAGDYEIFDKYFDFYEIDMTCPADGNPNSKEGKMRIGLDTSFAQPTMRLSETPGNANVTTAVREFLDENMDVEREILRSVFVREYNSDIEKQLIKALPTVLDLSDQYCSERVLTANKDIISLAYGDEGMSLIEEVEAGISDHKEGVLDEQAASEGQKSYDLSSAEFQDPEIMDLESVDLDMAN